MRWRLNAKNAYNASQKLHSFFAIEPHICQTCWGRFWLEPGIRRYIPAAHADGWEFYHDLIACVPKEST